MHDIQNYLKDKTVLPKLGFDGVSFINSPAQKIDGLKTFSVGVVQAKTAGDAKSRINKLSQKFDILAVEPQGIEAARAAAESGKVDVLFRAFIDQPTAMFMGQTNTALDICLKDILDVYGIKRSLLISKMRFNINLCRKYKVPITFSTGARDIYDIRTPKQIQSIAEMLGMSAVEAKQAVFENPRALLEQ